MFCFFALLRYIESSDDSSIPDEDIRIDFHNNVVINYKPENNIQFGEKIGYGRFSEVFIGNLSNGLRVAAKRMKPTAEWRLRREINCLQKMNNTEFTPKFYGVYGNELDPILVTEYVKSIVTNDINISQLKWIMKQLLEELKYAHERGVMHRDVKWQNIIIDTDQKKLWLLDWGLCDIYQNGTAYNADIGTKSYKAPELLMNHKYYSPKVDEWAAGCVMANLMFGLHSFFQASDNQGVLNRHARLFGTKKMNKLAQRYGYKTTFPFYREQHILEYALPHTRHLITRSGVELLEALLEPDPELRISAAQALDSNFFKE